MTQMRNMLLGTRVLAIWMGDYRLQLLTQDRDDDVDLVAFEVEGDCCSRSYFHDIVGVRHLLENGPVTAFEPVDLQPGDVGYHDPNCEAPSWSAPTPCGESHDVLKVYGWRFTTMHPQFGEVSTVVAFRNDSNGYYGGWMQAVEPRTEGPDDMRRVTADVIGGL